MTKPDILQDANELMKERFKKYEALKALGVDPFGGRFEKDAFLADVVKGFAEEKHVRTAGRLTAMRVMGKTTFCDVRDETGRLQLFVKPDGLPELDKKIFDLLDLGDIVGAEGPLFKTKTGEISIRVEKLALLSKSLRPMPEKWHGLKDTEARYRRRYLDLISNEDAHGLFKVRSLAIRSIRKTLDDRGYLEVETPMMHPIPGGAAGKPFKTHHEALGMDLYLRVAPELYLKRLLVGGFDRVYEINKSFRNEGISTRHNPEFTMLEVYTAYHDVNDVMDLCEAIVKEAALASVGKLQIAAEGKTIDLSKWRRVSFAGLMKDNFGIVPEDDISVWVKKLRAKGIDLKSDDVSRTQIINIVGDMLEVGELEGGLVTPVFVTDYFSEISPLARKSKINPHLADRFELYIGGMEVANGYSEQNDPLEQRERFVEELREKGKAADGGRVDEDYLFALEHGMPPAGGLGIGIDRLVMTLTGQPSIREVILFPQMKADKTGA